VLPDDQLPLVGDTTSNQLLIFSPPFAPTHAPTPSYPNYTLPAANLTQPPAPASSDAPQFDLAIFKSGDDATVPRTGCALAAAPFANAVLSEQFWMRDAAAGWRNEWLVGALAPQTNYTAYVVVDGTKVGGPVHFVTKSGAHALSFQE
jgi:calcium channel MID1